MAVAAVGGAAALLAADIAETVLVQIVGQLVAAVLQAALAPELDLLQEGSYRFSLNPLLFPGNPGKSLSPADAANAQLRGYLSNAEAANHAAGYGVAGPTFAVLAESLGQPLPALTLMEAFRRGLIPWDDPDPLKLSVTQGIRESDTKNKYTALLKELQYNLPDPGTVVESRLRGYIKPADFDAWMEKLGYDATVRGFIFKAAGVPISPGEGYAAFHRGLIPKDDANPDTPSLAQIFRESRINDKYLDVWMALQAYIPPPRTVTALLRAQSITEAKARELFKDAGLADDLIDAYVADASKQKIAATKDLAVGTVVNMYKAKELSRDQAMGFIEARGYSAEDAGFLLDYGDFQLIEAQVSAITSRLRTLFTGHKITAQQATDALANVGMGTDTINALLAVWTQEANASPVLLTAVQIADAAALGSLAPLDAWNELQGRGYDARDAYLVLKLHKVDVSSIPAPSGVIVTP